MKQALFLNKYKQSVARLEPIKYTGKIKKVGATFLQSHGPWSVLGEVCEIINQKNKGYWGEVVSIDEDRVNIMTYNKVEDIAVGHKVIAQGESLKILVSNDLLGRVVNCFGQPIDSLGGVAASEEYRVDVTPPNALERTLIKEQISTGIKAIDSFTPLGKGQRVGIFAGSGVGKSTLLGMIARNTNADINVIALIGERGREVNEFIKNDLGEEGLKRSVLVVATSDEPPLARVKASQTATTIAEYFRDQGKDVMLLFDSVTRLALAQREIGLSIGEPPATRGFPPSVYSLLPKIMERSGTAKVGSITGLYTVLVEGDDMDEPIADTVRGILDGHIVLTRELAHKAHYPAIDVLSSISRLEKTILNEQETGLLAILRRYMAIYKDKEDLINIGAYETGSNVEIDQAIALHSQLNEFLQQRVTENFSRDDIWEKLIVLTKNILISSEEGN